MKRQGYEKTSPKKRIKLNFDLSDELFDPVKPAITALSLEAKLHTAMHYANNVCILGASNKAADIAKNNGWPLVLAYHGLGTYQNKQDIPYTEEDLKTNMYYSETIKEDGTKETCFSDRDKWNWYFHKDAPTTIAKDPVHLLPYCDTKDPLNDPVFNLSPSNKHLLESVILINKVRFGNCESRCMLVADWLWRHAVGIESIELIVLSCDHVCVFVNREGDSLDTGWVIDPWWNDGIIYPVTEFMEKIFEIEAYCNQQGKERYEQAGYEYEINNEDLSYFTLYDIRPETDKYPRYETCMSVEDYYYPTNIYPTDILPDLATLQETHRQQFNPVLSELKTLKNDINQRFFSVENKTRLPSDGNQPQQDFITTIVS